MRLLDHALRRLAPAALAATLAAAPAPQAEAAIVTLDYTVSATSFNINPGVDPVVISFSVSYDNALPGIFSSGVTINSANIATGSTFGYAYNITGNSLTIGGGPDGAAGIGGGTADFEIILLNVSTSPAPFLVSVATPSLALVAGSTTITMVNNTPAEAIPEPASLALFGVAMAALGTLRARRKAA